MRQYYASDKKKREEAKRKQQEQKRLKRMNRSKTGTQTETTPGTEAANVDTDAASQGQEP